MKSHTFRTNNHESLLVKERSYARTLLRGKNISTYSFIKRKMLVVLRWKSPNLLLLPLKEVTKPFLRLIL